MLFYLSEHYVVASDAFLRNLLTWTLESIQVNLSLKGFVEFRVTVQKMCGSSLEKRTFSSEWRFNLVVCSWRYIFFDFLFPDGSTFLSVASYLFFRQRHMVRRWYIETCSKSICFREITARFICFESLSVCHGDFGQIRLSPSTTRLILCWMILRVLNRWLLGIMTCLETSVMISWNDWVLLHLTVLIKLQFLFICKNAALHHGIDTLHAK